MSNLYSQRNYHFLHNQLSASNPFNNISTYNAYQQKASSLPKNNIPQTTPLSNTANQYTNSFAKNSLYSNTQNKFLSNLNPTSSTMNFQERVIAYGQDKDENYFKRSLRKSPVSNPIQSSSYNIINNIPNTLPLNYGTMSGTGAFNLYNQRRDHVADLLNYSSKPNLGFSTTRTPPFSNTPAQSQNNNIRVVDSIDNVVSGMNNEPTVTKTPLSNQRMTPMKQEAKTSIEKISMDIPEYNETGCSAVIEYAYKEDPNSRFRGYMEDKGKAIDCFNNNPNDALFCLFDGHGGGEVSKYLQENFANEFKSVLPSNNIESTLISLFQSVDEKIKQSNFFTVGSTACVVYITKEGNQRILYCANIGDTRCTLVTSFQSKRLSYDDRASDKNEYTRITNSGGIVFAGRVYGQLMLSRAFGDWELKPYGVINVPHVVRMPIEENDKYLIIASDGIWDVFQDEDMYTMSKEVKSADEFCKNIIKEGLQRGTMDNISCFVVKLN